MAGDSKSFPHSFSLYQPYLLQWHYLNVPGSSLRQRKDSNAGSESSALAS